MAIISLSKAELNSINQIGALLNNLAKVTGSEEINEIRYYEEYFAAKAAKNIAEKKTASTAKSEIEKLL